MKKCLVKGEWFIVAVSIATPFLMIVHTILARLGFTGAIFWVHIFIAFATIASSGVIFFERTRSKHAEERLRQLDKAKTEFVSVASHQLRTPLTSVGWYAELLLKGRGGDTTDKGRDYLEKILNNNNRMVALVNSLLNVSRIEMGTLMVAPEPTNVVDVADDVLDDLSPHIQTKHLRIKKVYEKGLPIIEADPQLIRMIFQNLLSNAVEYIPQKGSIVLSMKTDASDLFIQVSDTGYGIPQAQQSQIFTKLFRADNVREKDTDGTGLGLYIVKSIVDQSGGNIWFDSIENVGTNFYVTLPLKGMKKNEGTKGLA